MCMGFPSGSVVKNLPANSGDTRDAGSALGWEKTPEKEIANYSRVLAWEIPWTEESARRSQRMGHH